MQPSTKMSNYRWVICSMLFMATTINYMDRQVLSLLNTNYISTEFHWDNDDYGTITAIFSLFYASRGSGLLPSRTSPYAYHRW